MANNPYKRPDRFTKQAKQEGYAARSVYKLQEIDERVRILKRGQRVVDLGCAPGSWSMYVLQTGCRVVGVDLTETLLPEGAFLHASVFDITADALQQALGGPADVVLSDMAPLTTGARDADHFAQIELATRAFDLACEVLTPGGAFLCKVFEGSDAKAFEMTVRKRFTGVRRIRPEAVRQSSREWFLVAEGFR